jgi:hypothetical protein
VWQEEEDEGEGQVRRLLALSAAILLLGLVGVAAAAEVSRDEYVERVEPICQVNTEANERILAGVRAEVNRGHLKAASQRFAKAAQALKQARAELVAVPQPSADKATLAKWLGGVKSEVQLLETVSRKLASGEKIAAQKLVVKLNYNAAHTNAAVVGFEFRYCRFEPAKFI